MSDQGDDREPEPASPTGDFGAQLIGRLAGRDKSFSRYQLEGELARGGQGAILRVWDEDLRRNLAMKVTLSGGEPTSASDADPKTLGRFLEEAQVTGQLDHPGIVPVHELGLDHEGGLYFTMRLVKGVDLARVFEMVATGEDGWNKTRVLGVLLKVCEAMSYAHSKRVIHRDLKPANVMVGRFGEAYVMDWGLARVQGTEDRKDIRVRPASTASLSRVDSDRRKGARSGDDSPLVTMDGDVLGTPAYMSPEQARGDLEAMGPASDVYSMGAILYELLAGHAPYVPRDARLNAYAIWGLVQNGPPTPVSQLARDAPVELVAICEKAMAREPAERYADMKELAEDLRAFLEHRVVSAYETGAVAELRKWVARNKPLALASAAAVLALVAGLAASSALFIEARANARAASENATQAQVNESRMRQERDRADGNAKEAAAQAELARAEAERATREEETTSRVLDFLTGMFEQAAPSEARGATVTVKEVLDRGAAEVEALAGEPEIQARLLGAMGELYDSLGLYRDAHPLLEKALSGWRAVLGATDPETLESLQALANSYTSGGRYVEAEPLFLEAIEGRRNTLGEEHLDTLDPVADLGRLYKLQGRYADSERLLLQALEKHQAILGENHPTTLAIKVNLAQVYLSSRRLEEAETITRETYEKQIETLGENDPGTLATESNLVSVYALTGRMAEAEELLLESIEKHRTVFGEDHHFTLIVEGSLPRLYWLTGRLEEAEAKYLEVIEKQRAAVGEDHQYTLKLTRDLAAVYLDQGRYEEAEPLFTRTLEAQRRTLGDDHPNTAGTVVHMLRMYREWLPVLREASGERAPGTLDLLHKLGDLLRIQGHDVEAEPLLVECHEGRAATLGEQHPDTLHTLRSLAELYADEQRWEDAELAAGALLESTDESDESHAERQRLLERIIEARQDGD